MTARPADRLNLPPAHRILTTGGLAGTYGLFHGITRGARLSSLRYLAENAHRLPRTKGTWYFFHKRKNYVLLKDGMNAGFRTALKFAIPTSAFFTVEAACDNVWGVSWMSTAASALVLGSGIAFYNGLKLKQSIRSVRNFTICGALAGAVQDTVRPRTTTTRS